MIFGKKIYFLSYCSDTEEKNNNITPIPFLLPHPIPILYTFGRAACVWYILKYCVTCATKQDKEKARRPIMFHCKQKRLYNLNDLVNG